jgi:predicted alpha/beta superfamily hydrolase
MRWEPYVGESVVGDVRVLRGVLDRDLFAYLPPSHGTARRRFPVVYMHDAQNLFDEGASASGEWRVDETMQELTGEGREAIVVGIPHAGERRGHEYAGDGAEKYLAFVVDEVRPLVTQSFDVADVREATGIAGSSLGAVASLHALFAYPAVFGFAGVFSPAFWWNGDDRWFDLVDQTARPGGRIYIDVGDDEGDGDERRRRAYLDGHRRMVERLQASGYGSADLCALVDAGGRHHETAWARRLPDALRFLLPR